jgi:tetratricopeptide (TPR) repeat protein
MTGAGGAIFRSVALPTLTLALLCAATVAQAPTGAGEPAAPDTAQPALARIDELWKRRDDKAALAEQKTLLDQALARAPNDYAVLWRVSRWYFWRSDDPELPTEERTKLGKTGWDLAEKAIARNPGHVAGHFWAAANMGNYALGLGIVRALAQRIEGKFKERLSRAEALDPGYAHASIQVAWARYHAKLPWPKYDQKKARAYYRQAFERNPHNLRARVFLAELLLEEDEPEEARRLIAEVLRASPGKYDAPEERRSKLLADRVKSKLDQKN